MAAAVVIAARKIEKVQNLDYFASICQKLINWALYTGQKVKNIKGNLTKKKLPEVGFDIAKAFNKAAADLARNEARINSPTQLLNWTVNVN